MILRQACGPASVLASINEREYFGEQRFVRDIRRGVDVLANLFHGRHPGQRGRYIRMREGELQREIARANAAAFAEFDDDAPGVFDVW